MSRHIAHRYISALEMHYHAVLSAPSPSAPLLARLLEKRCRFLTGLSGLQSIPLSCSRGAQELALGARLMADAVAVLQAPPVEDMSPVNLVCAVCVEGCRVASASLVTAGDGLSQESSVQVRRCDAVCILISCVVGIQALGPPCKTLCRAMATLQSLAGRRAAYSSIIRLTAGRSWALLLRALVTLVAGLPPLLRDNVAYTCLLEEVSACAPILLTHRPIRYDVVLPLRFSRGSLRGPGGRSPSLQRRPWRQWAAASSTRGADLFRFCLSRTTIG